MSILKTKKLCILTQFSGKVLGLTVFLPLVWGWDVTGCITDLNLDGVLHPIDAGYDEIGWYTNMDDWIQILEFKKIYVNIYTMKQNWDFHLEIIGEN